MTKRDRLDELIDSFNVIDGDIKLLSEKKGEIKEKIEKEIDTRVRAREEIVLFDGEMDENEVKEEAHRLLGDLKVDFERSASGDWLATVVFPPEQESATLSTGKYEVKRTVFTRDDSIDFDRLKEIEPDVYDAVVSEKTVVERSINSTKMKTLLKKHPELLSSFRRCTVRGKPQSRLTFKRREDE